ncbi:MAG: hypothetical protein GX213_07785 [Clostridiaceae bacterium]|nr:hypothetical protein [Clostridiaceae bacterium]
MKIKKSLVLLLFLLIPTAAGASVKWRGKTHVTNIKNNLHTIEQKLEDLKRSNVGENEAIRELEKLLKEQEKLVKDKDKELANKQKELEAKQDEIEELKIENAKIVTDNNALRRELEQAIIDIQEIEQLTEEIIKDGFGGSS